MIYTLTLNPSLDYVMSLENFETGMVNRSAGEMIFPGGKGINVSIVLKNLEYENTALGFVAGFTGKEIVRCLVEKGIQTDFVHLQKGLSRINVKLHAGEETEINGQGPEISSKDMDALYEKLNGLEKGDMLVLAGSIPPGMPAGIYMDIMRYLEGREICITVDATKRLLTNVLPFHPFLIKPNHHELGEIFGVTVSGKEDAVIYAERLRQMGAVNVLVSMAGDGAVLLTEEGQVYFAEAPSGQVVNAVGAGDSMVAGFLAGYQAYGDYQKAFYMGVCAGSASAFSKDLATKAEVMALLAQMPENCLQDIG